MYFRVSATGTHTATNASANVEESFISSIVTTRAGAIEGRREGNLHVLRGIPFRIGPNRGCAPPVPAPQPPDLPSLPPGHAEADLAVEAGEPRALPRYDAGFSILDQDLSHQSLSYPEMDVLAFSSDDDAPMVLNLELLLVPPMDGQRKMFLLFLRYLYPSLMPTILSKDMDIVWELN